MNLDYRPRPDLGGAAALPEPSFDNPVAVMFAFVQALGDPGFFQTALEYLTTPESRDAWGDFTEAAAMLAAIEDRGLGSM